MKRYSHFLRKNKSDRYPQRVVGLSVDCEDVDGYADSQVRPERLSKWSAASAVIVHGDGRYHHQWTGGGPDSVWDGIDNCLAQSGQTLIVCNCASRVWGLIGLWDKLESGDYYLGLHKPTADDPDLSAMAMPAVRTNARLEPEAGKSAESDPVSGLSGPASHQGCDTSPRREKSGRHAGYTILEDPPSALTVRKHGLPGNAVMIDVRNYGIECYPHDKRVVDRAVWLRDTMMGIIGTLHRRKWGSLYVTAGSQAMSIYKCAHMTHSVHCHSHPEALRIEDAAYYGGRCECRRLGRVPGTVYHLDYRGLYLSICRNFAVPVALVGVNDRLAAQDLLDKGESASITSEVTIETDEPCFPMRLDGLTIYPVGRFRTTLCGAELAEAVCTGRVKVVHSRLVYRCAPALRSWAEDVWAEIQLARSLGDVALGAWLKKIAVCLPGKFGQRGSTWEPAHNVNPPGPWCQWSSLDQEGKETRYRSIGWQVSREQRSQWAQDACPQIASFITAAGRIALLRVIQWAGWAEVYYHDTDGLIVSQKGYERLRFAGAVANDELGKLRLVAKGDDLTIHGIKHYTLNGKEQCSGRPRGTIEPSPDSAHYWFREWLKKSVTSGRKPFVGRILRQYSRNSVYHHGNVWPDGRVTPFVASED